MSTEPLSPDDQRPAFLERHPVTAAATGLLLVIILGVLVGTVIAFAISKVSSIALGAFTGAP